MRTSLFPIILCSCVEASTDWLLIDEPEPDFINNPGNDGDEWRFRYVWMDTWKGGLSPVCDIVLYQKLQ